MAPDRAFDQLVAPAWEAYCGEGFERMCREALPLLYADEGVTCRYQVGEYWDRATQIDVVGLRADGWIDLGECKWKSRSAGASAERELAARVARYPAHGRTIRTRIFLHRAPRARTPDVYGLEQLYG